jgi:hypothetical protein
MVGFHHATLRVTMEHLSRDFRVVRLYRGRGFFCILCLSKSEVAYCMFLWIMWQICLLRALQKVIQSDRKHARST